MKDDRVVLNPNYYNVSNENKGKIFTVESEPWKLCGELVVKLKGLSGYYAVNGLTIVKTFEDKNTDKENDNG